MYTRMAIWFISIFLLYGVALTDDPRQVPWPDAPSCSLVDLEAGEKARLKNAADKSEREAYEGTLRVFIVEPEGRWFILGSEETDYAFLGFALEEELILISSHTDTVIWDGTPFGYGDITADNIMVIAALFDEQGYLNFSDPPDGNPFYAHYVDACAAATPGVPGSSLVTEGYTHTVLIEDGSATW